MSFDAEERSAIAERGMRVPTGELRGAERRAGLFDRDQPVYELGSPDPVGFVEQDVPREKATDAWHRELNDGRVEIMCKAPGFRVRVTAPSDEAWEAVEMFERWTGLTVQSDRRPPRRVAPPPGQLSMSELESEGDDPSAPGELETD